MIRPSARPLRPIATPLLLALLLAAVPLAAGAQPTNDSAFDRGPGARLDRPGASGPGAAAPVDLPAAVLAELEAHGQARVSIYFVLGSLDDPAFAAHPARHGDVHPFVVDLVQLASAEGRLRLDDHGFLRSMTGIFPELALRGLAQSPWVTAIEAAAAPAPGDELVHATAAAGTCTRGTFTACNHNFRFAVSANLGGTSARWKYTLGDRSNVFWVYGYTNEEILAKVLDACTFNNRYWVFAAAASGSSYTLTVQDTVNSATKIYTPGSCLVADTNAFPC